MTSVDLNERIPNNVGLADDRRLQRALEAWRPRFLDWWLAQGPDGFQERDVFLRTAVDVGREGWAQFDYVRMPDYRWGIFLADAVPDRRIGFGDHFGEPVWQEVPGEHRSVLQRLVVVQGDTEPASVEQQRHLGATAPSGYDLRNLFQINVEEARHLWAMVYLLHALFGRDGRDEADELLERRSGDTDNPRILGAFNEPTPDWLSFLFFTYFTDRDGKFQLAALAESALDPLARTCQFMLREEAHHMFVGASGIGRVVQRTVDLMREHDTDDVGPFGGVDGPTLQRYLNFHYSVSLDLFGAETSTNAANYFAAGLKGRFHEDERGDDHRLLGDTSTVPVVDDGDVGEAEVPALSALNETLRRDFTDDCARGVERWNRTLADVGQQLVLPHPGFNRHVGVFAGRPVTPDGRLVTPGEWADGLAGWLPSDADQSFVASLMTPVTEPGKMASWIAAPSAGIHGRPVDFDYVLPG
jgi:benzoyl-CoA 2,3-dioxygenase component B